MGEYRRAHIPGSTPLPLGDIEARVRGCVPDETLPITVYGAGDGREETAVQILRRMGFRNVRAREGGIGAWTRDGGEVATGWGFEGKQFGERVAVSEGIPHKTADELAMESGKDDVLIIDTRTQAEFEKGHLPGAVWLPPFDSLLHAADLCRRHRAVYVNCAGRTRSILGTRLLRRMGFGNVFAVENGTWGWIHSGRKLEKGAGRRLPEVPVHALQAAEAHGLELARSRGIELLAPVDAQAWLASTAPRHYIVDVRHAQGFHEGHVPGALHIEGGLLQFQAEEGLAVRSLPVLVVGRFSVDGVAAAALLRDLGYNALALAGGCEAWALAGQTLDEGDGAPRDSLDHEPGADSVPQLSWGEARALIAHEARLLDVRTLGEFALGHVPGAMSLPLGCVTRDAGRFTPGVHYIAAANGLKATRAAARLRAAGLRASALRESVEDLPQQGVTFVEGVSGSGATLDDAKDDVNPFQRRGSLRQTVAESHAYLEWETALAHGVALPAGQPVSQP